MGKRRKGLPTTPKASPITITYADGTQKVVKKDYFRKIPYWRSKQWRNKRKRVLRRDNNQCTVCKSKSKLEVHHMTYENFGNEKLEELVTLCQTCHSNEHKWLKRMGQNITRPTDSDAYVIERY